MTGRLSLSCSTFHLYSRLLLESVLRSPLMCHRMVINTRFLLLALLLLALANFGVRPCSNSRPFHFCMRLILSQTCLWRPFRLTQVLPGLLPLSFGRFRRRNHVLSSLVHLTLPSKSMLPWDHLWQHVKDRLISNPTFSRISQHLIF